MRRGGRYNAPKGSGPHGELFAEDSDATETREFVKTISGNRDLSFARRQASPTGATHDRPVAGYPAAGDMGFPSWGISPTRRAMGGAPALPTGAPPKLNYLPRVPAPTAALGFVKTISGTRCLGLSGRPRT